MIFSIPIAKIKSLFPRLHYDEDELRELMTSIEAVGVVEPLLVMPAEEGDYYLLVYGSRRLEALKRLGKTHAPCEIRRDLTYEKAFFIAMHENLHRSDPCAYELALRLREAMEKFNLPQAELAERLGKSEGWVSQRLRILKLEGKFTWVNLLYSITERQARAILSAPEEYLDAICRWVEKEFEERGEIPSAREIEEHVREMREAEAMLEVMYPSMEAEGTTDIAEAIERAEREGGVIPADEVERKALETKARAEEEITTYEELVQALEETPPVAEEAVEAKAEEMLERKALRNLDKMLKWHDRRLIDLAEMVVRADMANLEAWRATVREIEGYLMDFLEYRGLKDEVIKWMKNRRAG